ncbi:GNAT family N-acetyltransferase [Saccharothrix luteola]|uniref:GNAT family N-acetyltransferase n=1 Tax=Saccharothrix luteola TaxID=2893018 RepID=UPI001E3AB901|nr:GNAT family N-acetyltransferase [Saccharothrix luteola]MCC8244651.1 GNAT family N-acetyltransferase [Saccharothrix luteola]
MAQAGRVPAADAVITGFDNAELRTERLTLRRPVADDVVAVHEIHRDPLACAHNPSDALRTPEEAAGLLERWLEHWRGFGFGYWVVRPRDAGRTLGFCGVKLTDIDGRRGLNLFYRFDPAAWGRGIASEAAREVVRWARATLPALPVVARVRPANTASQRVAVNAGLTRADHLDRPGEDGPDLLFAAGWAPSPPVKGPFAR